MAEDLHATLEISGSDELHGAIVAGYQEDTWCQKALATQMDGLAKRGNLLYFKDRLVIPQVGDICETILGLAHKTLGHFGFDKTYSVIRESFYWPGMHTYLETTYIPSCEDFQRNKAPTTKPLGPLHPLPVPDGRFESIAMDFMGLLPEENRFDTILTITDRLGADIRLIPCRKDMTAKQLAEAFFNHWYCENGLPKDIVSDRDKLFLSRFWKHLHELLGIDWKLSMAFHPETDSRSEHTNKTVNQALHFHVDHNQHGWVSALPHIRFSMMNTANASTGYSGFQL